MTHTTHGDDSPGAWRLPIGAQPDKDGTFFRVWAANATRLTVVCYAEAGRATTYTLPPEGGGYFARHIAGVAPGTRYMYKVDDDAPRPDPASRWQPESVHTASCVVDPTAFQWTDTAWRGLPLGQLIIYEVHVGTATPAGTFDALIERLDYLRELGITAIELMPVADFPGDRNWGYDGVSLFAPARAYGGPEGLRRLVNAAHERGLAVLLDVVYNHLGPDGNYLRIYSNDYFTSRHKTPWGDALNMDGENSRPVRDFFIANAQYWSQEYHIDGLRLDATHAILDDSPTHILAELNQCIKELLPPDRHFVIIAENEHNDTRLVQPTQAGGLGLDGVWADDFHHQVRVALAGDNDGYYIDYTGSMPDLATTLQQGWFYTGQLSTYLKKRRGTPTDTIPYSRFIHCIQNHDQVGNRAFGERLNQDIALEAYRVASVLLLVDPATPLLFQGQEWAASSPFLYFTAHNAELGRLVTAGRRAEFAAFAAFGGSEIPDPQAPDTFAQSKLRWHERNHPPHAGILQLYRTLLGLRRRLAALHERGRDCTTASAIADQTIALRRTLPPSQPSTMMPSPAPAILCVAHLGATTVELDLTMQAITHPPGGHRWSVLLDSEAPEFGGGGCLAALQENGTSILFDRPRALILAALPDQVTA